MYANLLPYPKEISVSESSSFIFPPVLNVEVYGKFQQESPSANRLGQIAALLDGCSELNFIYNDKPLFGSCAFSIVFSESRESFGDHGYSLAGYAQAYQLEAGKSGIVICANDAYGVFYGLTTLMQAIESMIRSNKRSMMSCHIKDWPSIPVRGHFDDISRKRISTTEDFKQIVGELGRYKINYYGMYLEDVLHINAFPDIGRRRGKLMQSEVKEIVGEAARNQVEIIPFFQLIGHCENLLAMPNYMHLGKNVKQRMSSLDPDIPEVREFLSICIEEVCALFPCEYFGMGFDETQGLDGDTYIRHANWCAEELGKYGKKPLLWADMFQKNYGFERIRELHPNIIIVNWQYDCVGTIPSQQEFEKCKDNVWGFGGYNSWVKYLPDFEFTKNHMDKWSGHFNGKEHGALFYSQWGDDGYENNRDLPWNLFAYAGETSWRGDNKCRHNFEDRYNMSMFGMKLPVLERLVLHTAGKMNHSSAFYWALHRENAFSCIRKANSLKEVHPFVDDYHLFDNTLSEMEHEFDLYKDKMRKHGVKIYRHFMTNIDLLRLNAKKMIVSFELLTAYGQDGEREISDNDVLVKRIMDLTHQIRLSREGYINDWLINNRREGLEVSTAVFDEVAAAFEEMIGNKRYRRKGFIPLDLSPFYNSFMQDIGGIPIGDTVLGGIPFKFAGVDKTFIEMNSQNPAFIVRTGQTAAIRDIHLIAASPMQSNLEKIPALKITLLKNKNIVWEDTLCTTEHICDWWAPYEEHIWAGGGYKYVDKNRVTPGCKPAQYYGLFITNRFPQIETECDELVISLAGKAEVSVFAVTLQV